MGFKKLIIFSLLATLSIFNLHAENHDAEQNIIEKAKEINQKVKEKQAKQKANISSEIGKEEPLPLNDPFVGAVSYTHLRAVVITNSSEEREEMSLFNFKLVGIMNGEYESYVSLINATGEIVTLQMNEELSPGIRLVDLRPEKAIFEKGDNSFLVINFKNQIKETSEPF